MEKKPRGVPNVRLVGEGGRGGDGRGGVGGWLGDGTMMAEGWEVAGARGVVERVSYAGASPTLKSWAVH